MARSTLLRSIIALLAVLVMAAPVAASDFRFVAAPLSGAQEVPAVDTLGRGVATFKLSRDETEMSFKLNVANLDGITQAHIHCGAKGVNGPVVVFLFGFVADGVDTQGRLSEGTITAANVIPRDPSAECPGGVANLAELIAKIRSGDAYVNVHTLAHPAGEIRCQIR